MSKQKRATIAQPQKDSLTTARRKNRGFVSLEVSCRIHRRAARRLLQARTQYGKVHEPGAKVVGSGSDFVHTAGGAYKYH